MSAYTLMVQGTTSDAGKTVLVAGLCRALSRRGVKVAPFKPQNMALNSAVTVGGGEIGRAQALQAQACGIEPHTDMNPILLKPSSDCGAQVIVQGKALSSMEAKAFHEYKAVAMEAVLESYHRLQQQYDVIIVEGAGSPAEINLRENDIANMGFAEAIDCPVIVVADIDRGGVFAHLVGTLSLLSESEQQRITGFVINRFRGDIELLHSGLDWLEETTHKKVWGVLPYLNNFYLDAEDAISFHRAMDQKDENLFRVVVPVFSRISNHTDFDALQLHPGVELCFVAPGEVFPDADLIILPGSKNVRKDLSLLYDYHWDQMIARHLRYGGKLIGVCGGYQMLGRSIHDPKGIEGPAGLSKGLGWLDITTELVETKTLLQVQAQLMLPTTNTASEEVSGYEIHCGVSTIHRDYKSLLRIEPSTTDLNSASRYEGVISTDGLIMGTYVHGLFDQPAATDALLQWAGLSSKHQAVDLDVVREQQLERLADCVEQHLLPELLSSCSLKDKKGGMYVVGT